MGSLERRRPRRLAVLLFAAAGLACPDPPAPNDPRAQVPLRSSPTWHNWTQDLVHEPSRSGEFYYFSPANRDELTKVVRQAREAGVRVRVSGQRHSQPPLVADDNRDDPPYHPSTWLVDLSCYADLGANGDEQIVLSADRKHVTVNAGVREDYLDAYLFARDLMLDTVTAGGFFSVGGMTAVDVHGATIRAPILAETVSSFTIMGPDGEVTSIDATTDAVGDWRAIQFARVSLGALGIVTSATFDVIERPYATSVQAGRERIRLDSREAFVSKYLDLVKHSRVESFYDPYRSEFLVLWWDRVKKPVDPVPNPARDPVATSCTFAENDAFGAPYEHPGTEWLAEHTEGRIQLEGTRIQAIAAMEAAFAGVVLLFDAAVGNHSDLWLTKAARVAFMSYFVELPSLDEAGLGKVWDTLDVVAKRMDEVDEFRVAAPLEFRFVRGGDSALSGTWTANPDATFVNLDLISFVPRTSPNEYPRQILRFFAGIEREWYGTYGGLPHNGKMYGFYDPATPPGTASTPFAPAFLRDLAERRGDRLTAFEAYRKQRDPEGFFCNDYLRAAQLCTGTEAD